MALSTCPILQTPSLQIAFPRGLRTLALKHNARNHQAKYSPRRRERAGMNPSCPRTVMNERRHRSVGNHVRYLCLGFTGTTRKEQFSLFTSGLRFNASKFPVKRAYSCILAVPAWSQSGNFPDLFLVLLFFACKFWRTLRRSYPGTGTACALLQYHWVIGAT